MFLNEIQTNILITHLLKEEGFLEGAINDFNKITSRNKICYLFVGHPRSGKSTIVNKILSKNKNIKKIDPDEISLMFTKDPNMYKVGSSTIGMNLSKSFFQNDRKDNASFIYDSTGSNVERLKIIATSAKKLGYKVIVINVFAPFKTTIDRNEKSKRQVSSDYLVDQWNKKYLIMKHVWNQVKPDEHFIVANTETGQSWYKYNGKKIEK